MSNSITLYENETPDVIQERLLGHLKTDIEKREGSFVSDIMGAVSQELHKGYFAFGEVSDIVWVGPNSGKYLDSEAEKLGIFPRKEGTKSSVILEITGEPGYMIPQNTVFSTEDGTYFDLAQDSTIGTSGKILSKATARDIGYYYNVEPNTITSIFTSDSRIERVTNPEKAFGGTDRESDSSLYYRIQIARQKPSTSGNKYDYERWALEVDGVGNVKVFSCWAGNGTVKVLIADEHNQPVEEEIIRKCEEHIHDVRPVGINGGLTVISATGKEISMTATVHLEKDALMEDITKKFQEAISEYFSLISFQENIVFFNWIGAMLIEVEGVKDYSDLKINGGTENIVLTEDEVPELGAVMLS